MNALDLSKIGASDMGALLGVSPWADPASLWARIVHGVGAEQKSWVDEGHIFEPAIRELYRYRTGYQTLGPASWSHPLYPWARCSPDDVALAPDGRRTADMKRSGRSEGWGPEGSDLVPDYIWLQLQFQMGVGLELGELESSTGDVMAEVRGEGRLFSIPFVPEAHERCVEAADRFWADFVVPKRFPEGPNLVLLERGAEALKALFPKPTQEALMPWEALPPEAQAQVRRWLEANAARKAWQEQEEAAARQVKLLLREVPGLTLPPEFGKRVDFKATKEAPVTDWEAVAKALAQHIEDRDWAAETVMDHTTTRAARPLVAR